MSEIRYDPNLPPVALLAAAEIIQSAAAAAAAPASAASAASSSASSAPVHLRLLPTAGTAVPTLTLSDCSSVLSGSTLLLRYLGRLSADVHSASGLSCALYGTGASQNVQVDFFLDMAPALSNKDTLNSYAKILDEHLRDRTTLVGDKGITIADLAVWEQLLGQDTMHTEPPFYLCPLFSPSGFKGTPSAGVMLAIDGDALVSREIRIIHLSPFLRGGHTMVFFFFPCAPCSSLFCPSALCSCSFVSLCSCFCSLSQSSLECVRQGQRRRSVPSPVPLGCPRDKSPFRCTLTRIQGAGREEES